MAYVLLEWTSVLVGRVVSLTGPIIDRITGSKKKPLAIPKTIIPSQRRKKTTKM